MELLRISGEVKGKYGYIDSDGIFKETSYGSGAGNNNNNNRNNKKIQIFLIFAIL